MLKSQTPIQAIAGLIAATLLLGPAVAAAQTFSAPAQQSTEQDQSAAVDSLASWTAMFTTASEQWVSANVTGDVWNQASSTSPNSFGTYPPILLYAGSTPALCGAPAATSQEVNLSTAGYLPANFGAAYSGEYCAMVYPDSGTATQSGPVGSTGGTLLVPASTVLAYFVADVPTTNAEDLLQHAPSQYVVSRLANLMEKNFAGGGTAEKYAPVISNSGQSSSTWTAVSP
jgi:hypothetical protein